MSAFCFFLFQKCWFNLTVEQINWGFKNCTTEAGSQQWQKKLEQTNGFKRIMHWGGTTHYSLDTENVNFGFWHLHWRCWVTGLETIASWRRFYCAGWISSLIQKKPFLHICMFSTVIWFADIAQEIALRVAWWKGPYQWLPQLTRHCLLGKPPWIR